MGKTLTSPKHEHIILNSMTQEKRDSLFRAELTLEWYDGAMVFRVFIFVFLCLELTVRKNTWMTTISVAIAVIFSKVPF